MRPPRRAVRLSDTFFRDIELALGPVRGPDGQPSATDFLVLDLPVIVEHFAIDFDLLPEIIEGFGAGRMLISAGALVQAFAAYGLLVEDGAIELIGIEFEL